MNRVGFEPTPLAAPAALLDEQTTKPLTSTNKLSIRQRKRISDRETFLRLDVASLTRCCNPLLLCTLQFVVIFSHSAKNCALHLLGLPLFLIPFIAPSIF
ncbi:hypothetical protein ElyMa_005660400 [Elysia marginata]|uniref:Uncharacterized protein n=1 Tax=Elysia marginata TaxID=1093978 RepID=A0AAV4FCZ9_9GAST|nr:hypothetical protein ElyMa_005660400 [Elysia marginata]